MKIKKSYPLNLGLITLNVSLWQMCRRSRNYDLEVCMKGGFNADISV